MRKMEIDTKNTLKNRWDEREMYSLCFVHTAQDWNRTTDGHSHIRLCVSSDNRLIMDCFGVLDRGISRSPSLNNCV